jgi:CBS domain-containing protein
MTIARLIEGRGPEIHSCDVTTSARDAVAMLATKRIGALPVLENGSIAGIFSERDAVRQLAEHGPTFLDKRVGEVMTTPAITVEPSTGVMDALGLMTRRRFRHLPVIDGERMIGFVSIGDLVKYRIELIEQEAEALRNYIQTA